MAIAAWVIIGALLGYAANRSSAKTSVELVREGLYGVAGALAAGLVVDVTMARFGMSRDAGGWSMLAATVGAIVVLVARRALRRRHALRARRRRLTTDRGGAPRA
jgi:uncharacterized membrane protein YeaQ/YmgE (transglycosylase-associated protein family)